MSQSENTSKPLPPTPNNSTRRTTIRPLPTTTGSSVLKTNNSNTTITNNSSLPSLPNNGIVGNNESLGSVSHKLLNSKTSLNYNQFAQLLTTNASLLSALYTQRLFATSELDELALSIYQLSNSLQSICYMNKLLLGIEFEKSISSTNIEATNIVILRGNTIATKIMDLLIKDECVDYLKSILLEPLKLVLLDESLDLEIDPMKLTQSLFDQSSPTVSSSTTTSSSTDNLQQQQDNNNLQQQPSDAEIKMQNNLNNLIKIVKIFMDNLLSQKAIQTMPMKIKYIAKLINHYAKDQYRIQQDNSHILVGSFIFLRLFNPTIIYPECRDVFPPEIRIHQKNRRNLVLISKVIQQISNGFEYGAKEAFMIPLNPLVKEYVGKVKDYLVQISTFDCDKELERMEMKVLENVKNEMITKNEELLQHAMNIQLSIKSHESTLIETKLSNCNLLQQVINRLPKIEEIAVQQQQSKTLTSHSSTSTSNTTLNNTSVVSNTTTITEKKYQDTEKYLELLEKSKREDIRDLEALNVISCRTCDAFGKPIVIFSEEKLKKEDLERVLLYMIQKLDKIVEQEYVLIWCVSNATQQRPGFSWMLNVYRNLTRKYKKNLKSLYIVHPTMMIKVIIKCFAPFVSEKFWRKLHLVDCVQDIYKEIDEDLVPLPPGILAYDLIQNNITSNEIPLFGSTLEEIMMNRKDCKVVGELIPYPIKKVMEFIKENHYNVRGIFRVSGNQSSVTQLRLLLNHGSNVDLHHADCHILSSLVKLFLRELPNPLFVFDVYDEMVNLFKKNNVSIEEILTNLNIIISRLPQYHLALAKELFNLLFFIQTYAEENMMNAHNLAIVFGPNIIRSNSTNPLLALQDNGALTYATEVMITHCEQLFNGTSVSSSTNNGGNGNNGNNRRKAVNLGQFKLEDQQ